MNEIINISLDRELWDDLRAFAAEQTILEGKRVPVIQVLRLAIKTFLRLRISEINNILDRPVRAPSFSGQQPSPGQEQPNMKIEAGMRDGQLNSDAEDDSSVVTETEELDPIRTRDKIRDMNLSAGKNV